MASIRRGQLITTFGIGSIITDRNNESFMVLSANSWVYTNKAKYIVNEPHLLKYLGVKRLIFPPAVQNKRFRNSTEFALTVRFPRWYFCRKCKRLQIFDFQEKVTECKSDCPGKWRDLIPTRFLVVCENGHIDDFPFAEWVHSGQQPPDHELYYEESSSITGLAGIFIKCKTCGKRRSMQDALSPDSLKKIKGCSGLRPWLYDGTEKNLTESCDQKLLGVQKAASNVYFPILRNAIFVPTESTLPENLTDFLNNPQYVDAVKQVIHRQDICLSIIKSLGALNDENALQVFQILRQDTKNEDLEYNEIKEIEFRALKKGNILDNRDFKCTAIEIDKFEGWFKECFSGVSLVEKLRDTRCLVGFTRVKPYDEINKKIRTLISQISPKMDELPVDVIRGEGIFLEFNIKKLEQWRSLSGVENRLRSLPEVKLDALRQYYRYPGDFIMMHTMAHLLMNELCLISGYNSAALRERIYSTSRDGQTMSGILIYTNSGDSEGSLGGLVRNGKPGNLEQLVRSSIQKADWCTSDPICNEVIPQGYEGSNLAACHNCCLLPETSCEFMNTSLDRGLLRGSISDNSFGFFKSLTI
jgi:hypothetical protein